MFRRVAASFNKRLERDGEPAAGSPRFRRDVIRKGKFEMVGIDLIEKMGNIASKKDALKEEDVRTLMILARKLLDLVPKLNTQFLIIRLFANWAVHVEITQSNTGLRILSAINDALVTYKSADTDTLCSGLSKEIGFPALRKELKQFVDHFHIVDVIVSEDRVWAVFVIHLIEIVRDIPLSFPKISTLDNKKRKVYDLIARNSIKSGAGVVAIQISKINYDLLGATEIGERMCLIILLEDTTKIVVPLIIDVRL